MSEDYEKLHEKLDNTSSRLPPEGVAEGAVSRHPMEEAARYSTPLSPRPNRNLTLPLIDKDLATSFDSPAYINWNVQPSDCQEDNRSPNCLRWAHSLHALLQDGDGVKLFRQYLSSEGKQHSDALDFWFACEGLRKQQGVEKIMQLVKLIYKKYFIKSALPVPEEIRREIGQIVKSSQCLEPPVTLFDRVQSRIEHLIVTTTYPNFLKSDVYLQYLNNEQNSNSNSSSGGSTSSSGDFSNDLSAMASGVVSLPTLHEDTELIMDTPVHLGHTSGTLSTGYHTPNLVTPSRRLTRDSLMMSQKQRAIDRCKPEAFASLFFCRGTGAYAAYNSYNPVSRQDSEMHSVSSHSQSDARTDTDLSTTDGPVDGRHKSRSSIRPAFINKDVGMNQSTIPRTQTVDKARCKPLDPERFASVLIEKLQVVMRKQMNDELVRKKILEGDPSLLHEHNLRERLLLDDENDQSILDDHVSLVFPDTPVRSPGVTSPHKNKYSHSSRRRKEGSIFSSDSGNVYDFNEGSERKSGMVKSKSMPECPDERFSRGAPARRSSSSKKALADLTDSGVSVVSDVPPTKSWLLTGHSDMSIKQRSSSYRTSSTKKGHGSRSSSVERTSIPGSSQPFVAGDSGFPTMNLQSSILEEARRIQTQVLEEAKRKLEDGSNMKPKSRSSSGRNHLELAQSSQSTLRKSQRNPRTLTTTDGYTTVVFSYCDEALPYRTKIPGTQITLKQCKDCLPKKGNYRFFFKTICEELDNQVIQEEVSNDSDIVPLWEGKIMAQVKPID